ncbi:MAG TPA: class I SAM-dependent methyltransferase [Terracidiphilus sp.]
MNFVHRMLCSSSRWKQVMREHVLPWSLGGIELGDEVLEIGPGYGAGTDVLQQRVRHLTCMESDGALAAGLRRKVNGNVEVRHEDATASLLPGASFDSVVCFTMLHHVGSTELQNRLFLAVFRLLRPGGIWAGTDSLKSRFMTLIHLFDTLVLVDPETLPQRLTEAGFEGVRVDVNPYAFRFRARKPQRG